MDKPGQQFVIRMANGSYYASMKGLTVRTIAREDLAFHFKSRQAAFEILRLTSQFHMATILAVNAPQSQPEPRG